MSFDNALMRRLQLAHPIVQAPMAGGSDTPALAAAVGQAGGLGCIGAAYLTPAQIGEATQAIRARTNRPFGVNLFAPQPVPPPTDPARAMGKVAPYYAELGLPAPQPPSAQSLSFAEQFAAVLESGAAVLSFTMGLLPGDAVNAAKQRGLFLIGTATTVAEAVALERAGIDAVVAQGSEAGGHRGTFDGRDDSGQVGTMALVPQTVDAVSIPVIASGGIMDGRGIAAALALGASAVQMGTAFLTCTESGIPDAYRAAILAAREQDTRVTRAFSGRPARGIVNRFMTETDRDPAAILPFPQQNALTRPMRSAAAQQGKADYLSLWCGQGARLARRQSAGELVARLAQETERALAAIMPPSAG